MSAMLRMSGNPPKISLTLRKSRSPLGSADPLQIVVWLELDGRRRERVGAVNRDLAADAWRYGQDLVGELVETALQEADRRELLRSRRA